MVVYWAIAYVLWMFGSDALSKWIFKKYNYTYRSIIIVLVLIFIMTFFPLHHAVSLIDSFFCDGMPGDCATITNLPSIIVLLIGGLFGSGIPAFVILSHVIGYTKNSKYARLLLAHSWFWLLIIFIAHFIQQ